MSRTSAWHPSNKMELAVKSPANTDEGKKKLPQQFSEPIRADLIKRAVEAIWSHDRQPYSNDPRAGKKASAKLRRRRRKYRGGYGYGMSRVPRMVMSKNGRQLNFRAAFAPSVVGGYRAHPPAATKIWAQKINERERRKALRSAIAATVQKKLVEGRGHVLPQQFPFIISNAFEALNKTKSVEDALNKLGLDKELVRSSRKKIRSGKGKTRGRKYRTAAGPLIVVGGDCKLLKAAKNIPGVEIKDVAKLNASVLAPGANPGRLTLYTANAIDKMSKEKLFA